MAYFCASLLFIWRGANYFLIYVRTVLFLQTMLFLELVMYGIVYIKVSVTQMSTVPTAQNIKVFIHASYATLKGHHFENHQGQQHLGPKIY